MLWLNADVCPSCRLFGKGPPMTAQKPVRLLRFSLGHGLPFDLLCRLGPGKLVSAFERLGADEPAQHLHSQASNGKAGQMADHHMWQPECPDDAKMSLMLLSHQACSLYIQRQSATALCTPPFWTSTWLQMPFDASEVFRMQGSHFASPPLNPFA